MLEITVNTAIWSLGEQKTGKQLTIAFPAAYLDIKLKLVEVQPVKNTNISKSCGDSDFFPLKMTRNVPLDCWPYNHLNNFTEFVAFAVFWQNDLSCGEDSCK